MPKTKPKPETAAVPLPDAMRLVSVHTSCSADGSVSVRTSSAVTDPLADA